MFDLRHGDCLDVLRGIADNSVDAIVTDPPYGLSFMGKRWDYDVPSEDIWRECLRVLKPGGHLLAFAGTRTQHRMAVRIEDAGFEIRDMIAWVYGSGFPKSHDVSKAIDKAAGAEREVMGRQKATGNTRGKGAAGHYANGLTGVNGYEIVKDGWNITAPATPAARQWHGWGTALKPALEPITVARKPLIGTVAENVLAWGTGGVNVDGCRVEAPEGLTNGGNFTEMHAENANGEWGMKPQGRAKPHTLGRWPANLIHDGSEESTELLGSAARFFYCAKASKRDRDEGCEGFQAKSKRGPMTDSNWSGNERFDGAPLPTARNHHPTVKPTDLMRYLCRLVTPPNGIVLDPFMGSGSTGKAAVLEGFNFIGIEREAEYLDIARARIEHVTKEPNLWQS